MFKKSVNDVFFHSVFKLCCAAELHDSLKKIRGCSELTSTLGVRIPRGESSTPYTFAPLPRKFLGWTKYKCRSVKRNHRSPRREVPSTHSIVCSPAQSRHHWLISVLFPTEPRCCSFTQLLLDQSWFGRKSSLLAQEITFIHCSSYLEMGWNQ